MTDIGKTVWLPLLLAYIGRGVPDPAEQADQMLIEYRARFEQRAPGTAAHPPTMLGALDRAQWRQIATELSVCRGNKKAAAERLGVSRRTLYRILARQERLLKAG